jgi:transposase, IS5 family
VIDLRHQQHRFGEGFIHETVDELWEDWMRQADAVLEDEALLGAVYEALQSRRPRSRTHGRPGTPAEVVLRMMLLKHIRDWSFADLEREVRANLLYREFTRIGAEKVPDAKTLGRLAQALGPEVIEKIHARMVALAQERGIVPGRPPARGHHGGGDQHSLSYRQRVNGRWRTGAHSLDEEGYRDRRKSGHPTA